MLYYEDDAGYDNENYTEEPHRVAFDKAFVYPENVNDALLLIQEAVAGENEDREFYGYLIAHAPSKEDADIIAGIRDDEIAHNQLFRQVYQDLTGMAPPVQEEPFTPPATYCEGLRNALMGEQNAVRKYRNILFALMSRVHINVLTRIITDEIRHGILYSYLYAKNGCDV